MDIRKQKLYERALREHETKLKSCPRCQGLLDKDIEEIKFQKRLDRAASIMYMEKMGG